MDIIIFIHYYASEKIKEKFLIEVILSVTKMLSERDISNYVKRNWTYGPHFEIICKDADILIDDSLLVEDIKKRLGEFQKENGFDDGFNAKKYARIVKDTAKIERIHNYLPIKAHGYVGIEQYDSLARLGEYSSINEKVVFEKYNYIISPYIMELAAKMYNMNYKERIIYYSKILASAATNYPGYGARKGYLSFVSHAEGFLGNWRKKTQIYRDRFKSFYIQYKAEATNEIREVIMSINEENLEEYDSLIYNMNEIYKKFRVEIEKVIIKDKEDNRNKWISYKKREKEIPRRFRGKSKFHTGLLNGNRNFTNFIVSNEFNSYRLLLNFIYNQTPVIGFSSSSRMLSCYMSYHSIEECYGESWERLLGMAQQ